MFDPAQSKYGLPREEQVRKTIEKRRDAPEYLKNEQMYQEFTQKEYQMKENPAEKKERERIEREQAKAIKDEESSGVKGTGGK